MRYGLILLCCLLPKVVFADTPSDESIGRLMTVTKIQEYLTHDFFEQVVALQATSIQINVEETHPTISPDDQEKINKLLDEYQKNTILDLMNDKSLQDSLSDKLMTLLKSHYSQEEVDAIIAFYETSIGQRILEKQHALYDKMDDESILLLMMQHYGDYLGDADNHEKMSSLSEGIAEVLEK